MARTRDIRTNQEDTSCDVCGRTLLRGEQAESFLAGGSRRQVCELCTARAQHEGWIRESGGDDLALRHPRGDGRGRSFIDRFRARRERAREVNDEIGTETTAPPEPAPPRRREREREREREEPETGSHETPRRPRRRPRRRAGANGSASASASSRPSPSPRRPGGRATCAPCRPTRT